MTQTLDRRDFLIRTGAGIALASHASQPIFTAPKQPFEISLAEWSLHRTLFAKQLDNLDFPKTAKQDYGIGAVEFVNQFFKDKAKDKPYLTDLKKRAHDLDVKLLLIMIDGEGALGDPDPAKRQQAVENHYRWV